MGKHRLVVCLECTGKTQEELQTLNIPASKKGVLEVHGPVPEALPLSNPFKYAGTPELEATPMMTLVAKIYKLRSVFH